MNWANYYIAKWVTEGYNYCSAEIIDSKQKIIGYTNYTKLKFSIYEVPSHLYKRGNAEVCYLPCKNIIKQKTFYIWIGSNLFDLNKKNWSFTGNSKTPLCLLELNQYFLSLPVNFFDNAGSKIYAFEDQRNFVYPLSDSMYFSAVTITTLGFGDILPNSSVVRILVMIETLFGMVVIALFISASYDYIKGKKYKHWCLYLLGWRFLRHIRRHRVDIK